MDNSIIGPQITKYRKAAGITQEELGKAVGVSTQAVSRWECGGAPDVTLLPAIADRLGVSIDALFGREGGEAVDIHSTIKKWVRTLPSEQVLHQLDQLLWSAVSAIPSDYMSAQMPYPESCYQVNLGGVYNNVLNHSVFHRRFWNTCSARTTAIIPQSFWPREPASTRKQFRSFCRS